MRRGSRGDSGAKEAEGKVAEGAGIFTANMPGRSGTQRFFWTSGIYSVGGLGHGRRRGLEGYLKNIRRL